MKLNDIHPNVETSGDLEEQFFSIEDTGMIFDILRNKMYSNPILAICREISCNARDAHREVGKEDVPIHIHLPNNLEPYYKIKDFGPGISPERMANIFIKYTASTKRNDNIQTGGFGLGAKTPFSYSDSFSIITNYNGVQYNYNCFIDPSKVGKLALGSEAPTSEPNGTEIIIPVNMKNYNDFIIWTEKACRHWKVKPIIKGGNIDWTELSPIVEGKDWAVVHSSDYNRQAMMIIDGIEYPLPMDTLKKYADSRLIDSARGNFVMYFEVGELSLSASREQIYLDEKTKKTISNRLERIVQEIKQKVVDKIDTFTNLWDVHIYYRQDLRKGFHTIHFLGSLKWSGIELNDNYVNTGCATFYYQKGYRSRYGNHDPNKIKRSTTQHILFEEHSALFINDLPLREPTPRHVRKAFDDDPKLTSVQLICPNDKKTVNDLNTSIHLDKMNPRLLSSITKASARTYTPASSRVLVFKFDKHSCGFRQSSYSAIEEDASHKVLCMLTKEMFSGKLSRQVCLNNKNNFSLQSLRQLAAKYPNMNFYGVDESTPDDRLEEDFSELETLDEFLGEQIDNSSMNFLEIKFATANSYDLDHRMIRLFNEIKPLIKNSDSLFLKRLKLHMRIEELAKKDSSLLCVYESIKGEITKDELDKWASNNPDYNITEIDDQYKDAYPLLNHLHYYASKEIIEPVAHYINSVDNSVRGESNV